VASSLCCGQGNDQIARLGRDLRRSLTVDQVIKSFPDFTVSATLSSNRHLNLIAVRRERLDFVANELPGFSCILLA
jgi:hypothetical protein